MRKENDARLAIRVPKETAEFIKYQASKEGVTVLRKSDNGVKN